MPPTLETLMSRLRLRQLRLLMALDECGSIHKAAEQVAISQPGATRALNEIESTLGASLFLRSARGLEANDLGRCVVRYARLIQTDVAHLREEMIGIQQGYGGHLAVGGTMGAIAAIVEAIVKVRAEQPSLSLQVIEDTSEGLLRLLDQGRIDVALCRSSFGRRPSDYHCHGHFPEPLWVVANPGHPLVEVEAPDFTALARQTWIVYPVSMPRMLEQEFVAAGLSQPVQSIEISSTYAILAMLEQDAGVLALLPERIAQEQVRRGQVARIRYRLRTRNPAFELLWRRDRELSPAARRFLECYDAGIEGDADIC
ncbi:LysR family transcriptional regulator [Salinicola acroporae]|uniref:LysR family transcriptional regulator n=1 Tax=Salinicola acroporae TaxID=1541440 RepID=A0ABT6I4G0_9GAMM|nr:LysR family transcriptional regulator [Salinicola acroporae]MDH4572353.1 LysR family transcriptional regulator [Salinicola acroporae]